MLIVEILFVVSMFLWLLTLVPYPPMGPLATGRPFLAFIAVVLLGVLVLLPGVR